MIHLTKKWVRQNLVKENMHSLFIKTEFGYGKDLIAGMISYNGLFGVPYTTKDGRHWLMFSVRKIDKDHWPELWSIGRKYIMILHDADDFFVYCSFVSKMAVQEWLYTYFDYTINFKHIENCYHMI